MHHTGIDWQTVGVIAVLLIAIVLVKGGKNLMQFIASQVIRDGVWIFMWRHFSGAHYHGEKRTNATWSEYGTTTKRPEYERGGWLDQWEHKPRKHRALWRLGLTIAFAGCMYGLIEDYTVTINALKALAVYILAVIAFVTEKSIRLRVHNLRYIIPPARSLATHYGVSVHAMRRMIHIDPENVAKEDGEIGWMEVPPDKTPSDDLMSTTCRIFDAHLPADIELVAKLQQQPRIIVIQAKQKPPDEVLWSAAVIQDAMRACPSGRVVLGLDKAKQPYHGDLTDLDDPHWGFDVNTKFGKSNFLGITAVQILHQDPLAQVIVIDPKRSSIIDFLGDVDDPVKPLLKGVTMANDPEDPDAMWGAVQKGKRILARRSKLYKQDRTRKFPCVLIIIDELNQFDSIMKGRWNKLKFEDSRLPKADRAGLAGVWPGWDDIYDIFQTGRFVNMHLLICSQDFRDDIIGGRGGRNYFGLKGMAGFNPSQWDKFMQTKPVPAVQNHAGRWIFSDGSPASETWVQLTYADAEHSSAAYDYAAEGRELFEDNDGVAVTMSDADQAALTTDNEDAGLPYYLSLIDSMSVSRSQDTSESDGRVVIRGDQEAADYFGWDLQKFVSARRRLAIPGEFRKGRTPCWYEDDLIAWEASRPRSKARLHVVEDEDEEAQDG